MNCGNVLGLTASCGRQDTPLCYVSYQSATRSGPLPPDAELTHKFRACSRPIVCHAPTMLFSHFFRLLALHSWMYAEWPALPARASPCASRAEKTYTGTRSSCSKACTILSVNLDALSRSVLCAASSAHTNKLFCCISSPPSPAAKPPAT
jgi:hypothetical protein